MTTFAEAPALPVADDEVQTVETPSGRVLYVDPADERAQRLAAADGDLNPLSRRLWQLALDAHAWDVVVDVGVNYGEMLVTVDLPPEARVIGFEPNPAIRRLARRTLREHGLDVDLRPQAVSDVPGRAAFAVHPTWSGMSALASDRPLEGLDDVGDARVREVEVTTLDAVLDPALLGSGSFAVKVDVEGFEQQVLTGAAASLRRDAPWALMLEILHMPAGLPTELARRHAVVMLDAGTRRPTRVTADEIDDALTGRHVYPQDCLLVSPAALPLLLG